MEPYLIESQPQHIQQFIQTFLMMSDQNTTHISFSRSELAQCVNNAGSGGMATDEPMNKRINTGGGGWYQNGGKFSEKGVGFFGRGGGANRGGYSNYQQGWNGNRGFHNNRGGGRGYGNNYNNQRGGGFGGGGGGGRGFNNNNNYNRDFNSSY